MRALRDQRNEDRKAMQAALQAPVVDAARIESIRADEMKAADESSKRMTRALADASNVLNADQRQTFFKNWMNTAGGHQRHGGPGKRPG